jgi:PKD repeat protein
MADFMANVTSGIVPLTVNFTNLSSGIISGWNWDFGDGVTTTAHMPKHVYTQTGVYTVTLSVFGEGVPATEVKEGFVTVVDDLEFAFVYLPFVRLP